MADWQKVFNLGPGLGKISPHLSSSIAARKCWEKIKMIKSFDKDQVKNKYILPVNETLSSKINKNKNSL